jgi:nucleoside-diphosphate-sugar epimerase
MGRAFIIGGTGQIGIATAEALRDAGWDVTVAHRGHRKVELPGVRAVVADRRKPGEFEAALKDGADVVIDTVAFTPAEADQLLALRGSVGGYVVISSASVYADDRGRSLDTAAETGFPIFDGPIRETQPTIAPGPASYSTQKVALEQRLLESGALVTVLRPCAIHGPHSAHPREWWFVKRMLDKRLAIPVAFNGASRFQTSAVRNIAALIRTVAEQPAARILNAADPDAPTVAEIGATIAGRVGYSGDIVPIDSDEIGHTPWSTPSPMVADMSAAEALGYRPAGTYAETVGEAIDWLVARNPEDWRKAFPVLAMYPGNLFDYEAEDRVLAGLDQSPHQI